LSQEGARAALKDGDVHAVFVIGNAGFADEHGKIQTIVSPRYEAFARILLDAVRDRMDRELNARTSAFEYDVRSPDVPVRSDFSFTFPGLLALALVQLGLFATAVPLLQARERGTLRYLSLTALTKGELLAGQFAMRVLLAVVQITLILLAGSTMLAISPMQWVQVFAISILGILLLVAMGYALAGMARNQQMGTAMILLTNFVLLMGSNVLMDPTGSTVRYAIACAIPVSYLADLYRQVISGESGMWPVWLDVVVIVGAAVLATAVALRTFKFDTDLRATSAAA
jgi:ABC-2 type transport system permease protein